MHKHCGNLPLIFLQLAFFFFLEEILFHMYTNTKKRVLSSFFMHVFLQNQKKSWLNEVIIQIAALIINHVNSL